MVITDYFISISHSRFANNSAQKNGGAIKLSTLLHKVDVHNCTFINNHAQNGGVIFITLKNREVYGLLLFSVVNSEFINNSAVENGGVLKAEAMYSPTMDKTISIENVTLDSNSANTGGALYLSKAQNIEILNCILTNNHGNHASDGTKGGGAVAIINSVVSIKKTLFVNNKAQIGGALWIYATYFNMSIYTITIHDTTFQDNKAESGGALYLNNSAVNLSSGFYISNTACTGGAIFSEKSYLHIGTVYLADNKALSTSNDSYSMKGISGWSHNCYIEYSGKSGAIFIEDKIEDCTLNFCRLTWNNIGSINSTNNSATLGSVLYGGMINRCHNIGSTQILSLTLSRDNYNSFPVSSASIQLCFYDTDCGVRSVKKTVYLGQSFEVYVICSDQVMQGKDCIITSQYAKTPGVKYGIGESIRAIKGQEKLVFHAYSDNQEPLGLLTISSDAMCSEKKWGSLEVNVSIRACPLGFEKIGDHCSCDHRLLEVFKTLNCFIGNVSITIKDEGWFGYDSSYMRINNICPLNYSSSCAM